MDLNTKEIIVLLITQVFASITVTSVAYIKARYALEKRAADVERKLAITTDENKKSISEVHILVNSQLQEIKKEVSRAHKENVELKGRLYKATGGTEGEILNEGSEENV